MNYNNLRLKHYIGCLHNCYSDFTSKSIHHFTWNKILSQHCFSTLRPDIDPILKDSIHYISLITISLASKFLHIRYSFVVIETSMQGKKKKLDKKSRYIQI